MEQRKTYSYSGKDQRKMQPVEGVERYALVCAPIIASGDVAGSVMYLCGDTPNPVTEVEIKLVQAAASFLGKQMEE